jgi:riboflavin biosynthesis pyrimidine reductase
MTNEFSNIVCAEFLTKRYRKIMVEGGASIITSMLGGPARRWITRIVLTVAPCFMGGLRCVQTPLSPKEERNNGNATVEFHRMRFVQVQLMGGDLVVVLDPATSSAAVAAADGAPLK